MQLTLVGSYPSPFVRRIRLALEKTPFEFRAINIYEEPGRSELLRLSPINQIPVLLVNGEPLWDSRIQLQFLGKKLGWPELSIAQENVLTVTERMMDAGVALFLLRKSSLREDAMYPQRLNQRIETVMEWLSPWMTSPEAREWNLMTMTLVSALEWMQFREIHPIATGESAATFLALHAQRPIVQQTHPSKGA